MLTRLLNSYGSYFSMLLMVVFIVWTYVEPDFYSRYVKGELFLIWTCYVLPWIILLANVFWQFKLYDKWFGK